MADSFGKRYAKAARLQADADLRGFAETDAAWDTSKTFLQDPDPYVRLGQVAIFEDVLQSGLQGECFLMWDVALDVA